LAYIGNKPANKAVVASDLDPAVITGQTALATSPADTDEFLISDAGTLKRIDASLVGGGGITVAHQWRVTADFTGTQAPIASNWEQADTYGYGGIGTAMSQSSGIFTFPSTGVYLITANSLCYYTGPVRYWRLDLETTTDNSSYNVFARAYGNLYGSPSAWYSSAETKAMFDVTNTSTHKVRMSVTPEDSSTVFAPHTSSNETFFTSIRLGDT